MAHLSQYLPQNIDEHKSMLFKSLIDSPLSTDTFKIGDKVRIKDSETNEIWEIHKFIAHPSQKLAAILIQNDCLDASCLPASSVVALLEKLIFV
jgi:hypothetical protein